MYDFDLRQANLARQPFKHLRQWKREYPHHQHLPYRIADHKFDHTFRTQYRIKDPDVQKSHFGSEGIEEHQKVPEDADFFDYTPFQASSPRSGRSTTGYKKTVSMGDKMYPNV